MFQLSKLKKKLFSNPERRPRESIKKLAVPEPLIPHYGQSVTEAITLDDSVVVIKSALLAEGDEVIQVIFREDTLLDIDSLNQTLAKRYRRMRRSVYRTLLREIGMNVVPPVPAVTAGRSTVVVDRAIDALDGGVVDLTGNGDFAFVTQTQLSEWLSGCPRYEVTMPIHDVNPHCGNLEDDGDVINASIRKLTTLRIRRRLVDTLELPPLPVATKEIIQLRSNPLGNLNDLVQIIESDPTLAANVLRWANSSMYGFAGMVDTIHDAVNRVLGYDLVLNLCMGLVLGKMMPPPRHNTTHVLSYWEQALWVAHATATLADLVGGEGKPNRGVAYLTGLFHNFGYLVLSYTFPPHFRTVTESTDINRHLDVSIVDLHILGLTREQIASELMANWGMSQALIRGLRYQKLPEYVGEHFEYANLVFLARNLLIERGLRLGPGTAIDETIFRRLGMDPQAARGRIEALLKDAERIDGMAKLMG